MPQYIGRKSANGFNHLACLSLCGLASGYEPASPPPAQVAKGEGISTEMAGALANPGTDLAGIITTGDLQSDIEAARRILY